MSKPEEIYKAIMSIKNISIFSTEELLDLMGTLVDLSWDLKKFEGIEQSKALSEEILKRKLIPEQKALVHYYLGNTWGYQRRLRREDSEDAWDWEQGEIEKEIIHFRIAFREGQSTILPKERLCQILTNLGNLLNHIGRFVDAVEYWDRVLALLPSFAMAVGNRGYGLSFYAQSLYDKGHASVFLKNAHAYLKKVLSQDIHDDARSKFEDRLKRIESALSPEFINKDIDMQSFSLGTSVDEVQYRKWCLMERLFVNPLNDLGPFPIAARDVLTAPSIVMKIDEGPYFQGHFNQMKQEFVSARYLFYDGIKSTNPHFSDKEVLLYNTLDYPSYSLAVEKMKAAFRILYYLFDKIAYFLNKYLYLQIPEQKVTFRTFWYENCKKDEGLRAIFKQAKNWPLRGLFWLSKDLFEDVPGFKEAMEPDAQEINNIRNHLEHKYLKLHDEMWHKYKNDEDGEFQFYSDTLAFSINRSEFATKTMRLTKMVRAALIYLSLAIHAEEKRRTNERGSKGITPRLPLDIWEDDWKR
jgi:hypothetical protein